MAQRSSNHRSLARWAADCAGHVLPCFETIHPQDHRPHLALEAARSWAQGKIKCGPARTAALAAHAAARAASSDAACAAARAAGHAAGTAHVPGHARHAADYAIKAVSAMGNSAAKERAWQRRRLPIPLRPVIFPLSSVKE